LCRKDFITHPSDASSFGDARLISLWVGHSSRWEHQRRDLGLVGVLTRLLGLTDLVLILFLVIVLFLWFSVEGFVIGVIHGDSAIRKSEGRSSNDSRVSRSAPRIQKSVGVADYINPTEEFGGFCLLSPIMIGECEEQWVGKRRLHVVKEQLKSSNVMLSRKTIRDDATDQTLTSDKRSRESRWLEMD
jgi:hypothetical protein